MKKCIQLLMGTLLLTSMSCIQENTTDYSLKPETEQAAPPIKLSLEEARLEVENLVAQIDNTTRAGRDQRKIIDYYCIGKKNITRSSNLPEEDELLTYVFNFDNENGYAIVAADNGYYNAGVFNTAAGPATRTTTGQPHNYQYDIDMVYGVRI